MKDSLREYETDPQIERNDGRTFNLLTIRRKYERLTKRERDRYPNREK